MQLANKMPIEMMVIGLPSVEDWYFWRIVLDGNPPTSNKKGVPFVPVVSFRLSLLILRVFSTDSDRMDQVGAVTSHRKNLSQHVFNHGLHSIKKPHRW